MFFAYDLVQKAILHWKIGILQTDIRMREFFQIFKSNKNSIIGECGVIRYIECQFGTIHWYFYRFVQIWIDVIDYSWPWGTFYFIKIESISKISYLASFKSI